MLLIINRRYTIYVIVTSVLISQVFYTTADGDKCIGKPTGWRYQDPLDCHGFFVCYNNRPYQAYCDYAEKYDEIMQKCIVGKCPPCKKCDNDCSLIVSTTPSTTTTSSSTSPSSTSTTSSSTSTTARSTTKSSTAESTTRSTTQGNPNSCDGRLDGEMFRDPYDCGKFYVCAAGHEIAAYCPNGLYYDTRSNTCNYSQSVSCNSDKSSTITTNRPSSISSSTSSSTSTTSSKPTTRSTATPATTSASYMTTTSSTPTTTPQDGQIDWTVKDCYGRPNGSFFRNVSHCKIYYVCRDDMAVKESCPEGQWFDDKHFVCNLEAFVECPIA